MKNCLLLVLIFNLIVVGAANAAKEVVTIPESPAYSQEAKFEKPYQETQDFFTLIGFHQRFERGSDGAQMNVVTPASLTLGWEQRSWGLQLEVDRTLSNSGYGIISINQQEMDVLGSVFLQSHQYLFQTLTPFAAVGVGMFQESVRTNYQGNLASDYSVWSSCASAEIGVKVDFSRRWRLQLEARVLASPDFNPNFIFEMPIRFGFVF